MSSNLITHMRERIQQLRRVKSLAHDPRIIKMLEEVIASGEADIRKLESGGSATDD